MRILLLFAALALAAASAQQVPVEVQVAPDIVYAAYGTRQLKLDVYRPISTKPLPGIVVIRGGGWRQGDKQGFASIARNLAATGFVTACIEYRVLPVVHFPDPVYDTKAAVRWMRAEGKQYGIDPDRIGVIGASAGGHLVALLGTSDKVAKLDGAGGHPGISSRVQAVVALAPVTDFGTMTSAGQRMFAGKPELATLYSPVTHISKDAAPILLIHGDADKTVPIAQSQLMLERCKSVGIRASLLTFEGAPHGFWHQPKWAEDTIAQAAKFFHDVLGN
jgi:acetyl esterase/lipase